MTYRVTQCLACESPDLKFRAAITAPFVAARVFECAPFICRVAQCRSCGLSFFEDRFDDQEATKLYADYRSETYYQTRHYWEPWYTRAFNSGLGGTEEMITRRNVYAHIVQTHAGGADIESVLDYGGDRGQLVLGGPGRAYYVYDISGVAPEAGVASLDAASLTGENFDLVLLCEVLEHVSDPIQVLRGVIGHVRPGGLLYITVPNREFSPTEIPAGAWYRAYLHQLLKSRWTILLTDFWSTGFRVKFGRVPILGFVKMHEHVNFFDQNSLAKILRQIGLTILTCEPSKDKRGLIALCYRPPVTGP